MKIVSICLLSELFGNMCILWKDMLFKMLLRDKKKIKKKKEHSNEDHGNLNFVIKLLKTWKFQEMRLYYTFFTMYFISSDHKFAIPECCLIWVTLSFVQNQYDHFESFYTNGENININNSPNALFQTENGTLFGSHSSLNLNCDFEIFCT